MAAASERIDSAEVQDSLEDLRARIQKEVELLKEEVGEATHTLPQEPALDGKDLDLMLKTKLHLESEIEATMQTPLLELPEDPQLMMRLAKEEAEATATENARTLAAYREKIKELQEENKWYEKMVEKASLVDSKLDELLASQSEKDQLETLKRRYERAAVVFKALRNELHYILSEFYPDEDESLSMEDLLDCLVTKMLKDQNDPYVDIDDTMKSEHLAFLLRSNLIMRHEQNVSKVRFIDPRT